MTYNDIHFSDTKLKTHKNSFSIPALILQSKYSNEVITNLQVASRAMAIRFLTAYLLPHGADSADQAEAMAHAMALRDLQGIMDESSSKVRAVNTKCVCTAVIADHHCVVGATANGTTLLSVLTDCDVTSTDPKKVPFLQYASRRIAIALTSKEFRRYCKKADNVHLFFYWAFHLYNRTWAGITKTLSHEPSVRAAHAIKGTSMLDQIDAQYFKNADRALDLALDQFTAAYSDAGRLDEPTIFTTSPFGAAAIEKARAKLRPTPSTPRDPAAKKLKLDSDTKNLRTPGPVKVSHGIISEPPAWPPGETSLCQATLRDNSRGCVKNNCVRSHDPPAKWSPSMWTVMKALVAGNDNLTWNEEIVKPEMLGMEYSHSGKKVDIP